MFHPVEQQQKMRPNRSISHSFTLKSLFSILGYGHNADILHTVVCKSLVHKSIKDVLLLNCSQTNHVT